MSERDSASQLWYVVATKSRNEAVAKTNLNRQGYEVFCPPSA